MIVARYSGSVTVCSVTNLENLLGNSPEFLYTHPQIEELGDIRGFLCLDCEVTVTGTKRIREPNNENLGSGRLFLHLAIKLMWI